jgi:putative ATP-dependent endonuclease of the OLD family
MYIKSISIKNFRNFGDPPFALELRPFTLLLGENNIGKTNLLNAIALLFSQEIGITQRRLLEVDDLNYRAVAAFKKQVLDPRTDPDKVVFPEVNIEAVLTDFDPDQESVIGDWFTDSALDTVKITYRFAPRASFNQTVWIEQRRASLLDGAGEVDFPIGEYRYVVFGGGEPSNECEAARLGMIRAEILDALRDAHWQLTSGGGQRLLFRVLRQGADSKYTELKAQLKQLDKCIRADSSLIELKAAVELLLRRVSLQSSQNDNIVDFLFSSPEATELLKKIGMIYGVDPVSVERNGLGRNNLLYLSLVLSQLAKTDTPTNDAYACFRFVGVEEPEAHLHPHLQDHLARNIESLREENDKSIQLLLTSHSTHIAAKLNLKNTAVLFQDNPNGQIRSHYVLDGLDTVHDQESIRFLSLYLDATKSRMFFARRLILVEGISEQVLIPRLFEIHSQGQRSLESVGATVVNVNGVAFGHFLKIVRSGYFRRCAVLTDRDTGVVTEKRAPDLKSEFEVPSLIAVSISKSASFEKDLVASNRSGIGKQILLRALQDTRPVSGKQLAEAKAVTDLDVDEFFGTIKDYKAEFAFNLTRALDKPDCGFEIPEYIASAFEFLEQS